MSQAPLSLHIVIIGAGISGLAVATSLAQKGHHVQVLERGNRLSEFGAGIQIPPNAMRVLDAWGLKSEFLHVATRAEACRFSRYDSSSTQPLGIIKYDTEGLYGYRHLQLHRADYQALLYNSATKAGAQVSFSKRVLSLDSETPSLTLDDGSIINGDLIIGADGIGSKMRGHLFPDIQPNVSGDITYRILLPLERTKGDPEIAHLVERPSHNGWLGPRRFVLGYTIRDVKMYNLALMVPGEAPVGAWNEPADLEDVRREFADFHPQVMALLRHAKVCHKWALADVPSLPCWHSESAKLLLVGDAAHAPFPTAAQGAAQCLEDAAALGECLSHVSSLEDLPRLVQTFQDIRKERCEIIQRVSGNNKKMLVFDDGPEQEQRDAMFAKSLQPSVVGSFDKTGKRPTPDPNAGYTTPEFQEWLYAFDAIRDCKSALEVSNGA